MEEKRKVCPQHEETPNWLEDKAGLCITTGKLYSEETRKKKKIAG